MTVAPITPVILSGGAGSRLWPMSRQSRPKQFLDIVSDRSLFADTIERVAGDQFADPVVICHDDHRFLVAEEFRVLAKRAQSIICEPASRNTAPAIAAAAISLLDTAPETLMLVMPSDHLIQDVLAFLRAIDIAIPAARSGYLVTFGINPERPETGFGYIEVGQKIDGISETYHVSQFAEKPDESRAANYVKSGSHVWNSGIFLFSPTAYLKELDIAQPEIRSTVAASIKAAQQDSMFVRLDAEIFTCVSAFSIDVAVLERTSMAAVVRVKMGWSDVGVWSALSDLREMDGSGNVLLGDVLTYETNNSFIRSDGRLVAAVGVNDLVIVATDDAILVSPKKRVQDVRQIVAQLEGLGREEHITHSCIHRPWGVYQNLRKGPGFLVKEIIVKPGAKLSHQLHHHRAEHWIVVTGQAVVTAGTATLVLNEGESTYIPIGTPHRLENRGTSSLHVIEVQSGSHISEQDIVRMEDDFSRV